MRFAYNGNWLADADAPALSVSLPKRPEPFPPQATIDGYCCSASSARAPLSMFSRP